MTPGIDTLLSRHRDWLHTGRVAAIVHPASRTADGTWTPDRLHHDPEIHLTSLMGPEHGIEGTAAAGEEVAHGRHVRLDVPVWSLYGDTRTPTDAMLNDVDTVLFDLQDISVRCYTYGSTLHGVMKACDKLGKTLIVTDRPSPLMQVVDGPMLEPAFQSFVADIPTPLVYGMTSGELAHFLRRVEFPELDLRIAPCDDLSRETFTPCDISTWVPPSPAIRSQECACCFPATVFVEGIPAIDTARTREQAFQVLASPWMDAQQVSLHLQARHLPGVDFTPITYTADGKPYSEQQVHGLKMEVLDLATYRPAATMIHILEVLQTLHGMDTLWNSSDVRPEWFDKLMGTSTVREQLQAGTPAADIIHGWQKGLQGFTQQRSESLFY